MIHPVLVQYSRKLCVITNLHYHYILPHVFQRIDDNFLSDRISDVCSISGTVDRMSVAFETFPCLS